MIGANDYAGPIMLDTHRSKHFFWMWHKPKPYATPKKASDFAIQSIRSGAIPVERSTQPNRQRHQDEFRGRPIPDNCATAGRGRGEDCTMKRAAHSKFARRIERMLRRWHVDSEDCRLSACAIFAKHQRFPSPPGERVPEGRVRGRAAPSPPVTSSCATTPPLPRCLQRHRLRPLARGDSPRHQAGQHHPGPARRDAGGGLGAGQGHRPGQSLGQLVERSRCNIMGHGTDMIVTAGHDPARAAPLGAACHGTRVYTGKDGHFFVAPATFGLNVGTGI
jgi:hypothetical protein